MTELFWLAIGLGICGFLIFTGLGIGECLSKKGRKPILRLVASEEGAKILQAILDGNMVHYEKWTEMPKPEGEKPLTVFKIYRQVEGA